MSGKCVPGLSIVQILTKRYIIVYFFYFFQEYTVTDIFGKTTFSLGIIVDRSNG